MARISVVKDGIRTDWPDIASTIPDGSVLEESQGFQARFTHEVCSIEDDRGGIDKVVALYERNGSMTQFAVACMQMSALLRAIGVEVSYVAESKLECDTLPTIERIVGRLHNGILKIQRNGRSIVMRREPPESTPRCPLLPDLSSFGGRATNPDVVGKIT